MADLMNIRRRIIERSPYITMVSSGNTTDSPDIAHFTTSLQTDIKELKVLFQPKQSGSGMPSPSNIRPISGHNSIGLTRCGVNLLHSYNVNGTIRNITYTATYIDNEVTQIAMNGTANGANGFRNLNYTANMNNLVNGKIAVNSFSNQANIVPVSSYANILDIDGWAIGGLSSAGMQVYNINKSLYKDGWFRIQAYPYDCTNISFDTIIYPFVSLYQDKNHIFEPYVGQTITMTLPKECYGGYIDIINGTLVVTKGKCVVNEQNNITSVQFAGNGKVLAWCYLASEKLWVRDNPPICDRMVYADKGYTGHYSASVGKVGEFGNSDEYPNSLWFWLPYGEENGVQEATVAGVKTYLQAHPMTFIGDLETQLIYQLSPQSLKTLKGINNIWSDQGIVEVKYWAR